MPVFERPKQKSARSEARVIHFLKTLVYRGYQVLVVVLFAVIFFPVIMVGQCFKWCQQLGQPSFLENDLRRNARGLDALISHPGSGDKISIPKADGAGGRG